MRAAMLIAVLFCSSSAGAERLRRDGVTRDVPDESVEFALQDGYERIPQVYMREPDGDVVLVDEDIAPRAQTERGLWRMTDAEIDAHKRGERPRDRAPLFVIGSMLTLFVAWVLWMTRGTRRLVLE